MSSKDYRWNVIQTSLGNPWVSVLEILFGVTKVQ